MSETIALTAPVTYTSDATIRLNLVMIDIENQRISVQWLGNNMVAGRADYPTPAPVGSSQPSGATLLHTLNTGNFSTTSLVKNVFQRLQTDGYIAAGTISGTPA